MPHSRNLSGAHTRRVGTPPVTSLSSGANVKAVQTMLGHASAVLTLDTYSDLFPDDLDAVAARLDEAVRKQSVGRLWVVDGNGATPKPDQRR